MGTLKDRMMRRALGDNGMATAALSRTTRGLRQGDRTELIVGLVLGALAYLRRTAPSKTLVYRQELKPGKAVVIRSAKPGQLPVTVENPRD